MAHEISVLLVEPGEKPRPAKVLNTLSAFSETLGGPVEAGCFLPQRVMLVSLENGRDLGFSTNRALSGDGDAIVGPFLLCGFEGNSFVSLTRSQQSEFEKYFADPDWPGGGNPA